MGFIIAIDGPSASGKSTVAKLVAKKLNFIYVDTGAMYRALSYEVLRNKISIHDESKIVELLNSIKISFTTDNRILVNDLDVTNQIRNREVSTSVSIVSSHVKVREILVKYQQSFADSSTNIVMDGRDIGSIVFPNADLKIFQTASCDARAKRRFIENKNHNIDTPLDILSKEIQVRDHIDSNKKYGALVQAEDAFLIDTSNLTIEETVEKILELAKKKARQCGVEL